MERVAGCMALLPGWALSLRSLASAALLYAVYMRPSLCLTLVLSYMSVAHLCLEHAELSLIEAAAAQLALGVG
jgi:hypothetical protein